MTSRQRQIEPGYIYHVLNRGVKRQQLFFCDDDYAAFEALVEETLERTPLAILTYELMPNHWHFVAQPADNRELPDFFHDLTSTHAKRFHAARNSTGEGHVYQDRYKSFPVESDAHLLSLCRYVERNALQAGLVQRAEDWRWSGLWRRIRQLDGWLKSDWPVPRPDDWIERVNERLTTSELARIQTSVRRGRPLGTPEWTRTVAQQLGLQHTVRAPGRPRVFVRGGR